MAAVIGISAGPDHHIGTDLVQKVPTYLPIYFPVIPHAPGCLNRIGIYYRKKNLFENDDIPKVQRVK